MAKRTPEEILAQRDAWMARKAARDAGEDVPLMPPLKPGEEPPESAMPEAEAEPEQQAPEAEQAEAELEAAETVAETETAQPAAEEAPATSMKPERPKGKRTPEEIRAQREAFMAARAAKAAGAAAPEAKAEAPAPAPAQPAEEKPAPEATPKPAPKPKPTPKPAAAPAPDEPAGPITRREFLNYAWLASIALFTVETVGLSLWFAFPNFREGEFGGNFPIGAAGEVLPEVNAGPIPFTEGKFWLVNVDQEVNGEPRKGVLAIFKVCTHLGCLYDWVDVTDRFECPCHGSKFQLTGDYIAGPARRSLDRFRITAISPDGSEKVTNDAGDPLVVNDDDMLVIDTGDKILGTSDIEIA